MLLFNSMQSIHAINIRYKFIQRITFIWRIIMLPNLKLVKFPHSFKVYTLVILASFHYIPFVSSGKLQIPA